MSGVTIQTITQHIQYGFGLTNFGIVAFGILSLSVLMFILGLVLHKEPVIIIGLTMGIISLVAGLIACADSKKISYYNEYEVTIDETVSMQEFMSTYKIKDQRGGIYTVIEITEDGGIKYEYYN